MINDKRKSQRRTIRYTAWAIIDGETLHGCVLSDVSDFGARLDVENADNLPDQFVLLLSGRRGSPRRNCRVIWRKPNQVGVEFEKRLSATDTVTLVPKPNADIIAAIGAPEEDAKAD